jgi:hypothetical protein
MNIRKIILEEVENFDWIRWTTECPNLEDILSALQVGDKFSLKNSTDVWEVIGMSGAGITLVSNSRRYSPLGMVKREFAKRIMVGDWEPVS